MVARWLRVCLGAEAILLIAFVLLMRASGWNASAIAVFAVVAFIAANSVPFIIVYPIALYCRMGVTAIPPIGILRAVRGIAVEWIAFLAAFMLLQPFERRLMGNESMAQARGQTPVLLVHGYVCNRGQWWWLRRRLRAGGFAVATVSLEPMHGDIDGFAEQLDARIEALLADTGARRVALIGHSMGGLVARAYLRRHGSRRVSTLITLGSPHHGTVLAYLGLGRGARQMRPNSRWLQQLSQCESFTVPVASLWGGLDEIVAPQDSSRLAGVREVLFPELGHLSLLFSPAVLQQLLAELGQPASINSAIHATSA